MNRRSFLSVVIALLLGTAAGSAAAADAPRIGVLTPHPESGSSREGFRQGLRELGYIDKILKGAKPAELPIQQISRFELIIDLRLAREQGIKVPHEMLFRADRVIR